MVGVYLSRNGGMCCVHNIQYSNISISVYGGWGGHPNISHIYLGGWVVQRRPKYDIDIYAQSLKYFPNLQVTQ